MLCVYQFINYSNVLERVVLVRQASLSISCHKLLSEILRLFCLKTFHLTEAHFKLVSLSASVHSADVLG